MSATTTDSVDAIISTDAAYDSDDDYTLDSVGVELEYPLMTGNGISGRPDGSSSLRNEVRNENMENDLPRNAWLDNNGSSDPENATGYMGSDHVGAEITSGQLALHTDAPEAWYRASINEAERRGYDFAASGRGATSFGLHNHVSAIDDDIVDAINDACSDEWARVFFCTSVDANSLDPWRHGGVGDPSNSFRSRLGNGHYEFRLPEPMLPEHFGLLMDFWRTIEHESVEAAIDFARETVHDKDERLTAVQQYRELEDSGRLDIEQGVSDDHYTQRHVAEWFADLME